MRAQEIPGTGGRNHTIKKLQGRRKVTISHKLDYCDYVYRYVASVFNWQSWWRGISQGLWWLIQYMIMKWHLTIFRRATHPIQQVAIIYYIRHHMGWLRWVGAFKLWVSFAEYSLLYRALLRFHNVTSHNIPQSNKSLLHRASNHDPPSSGLWKWWRRVMITSEIHNCDCFYGI